jgi:dTDP-4-amino-4,6-dideoxygalactose transaminase
VFDDEIAARRRVADRYSAALSDIAVVPVLAPGTTSVWAQYTLVIRNRDRIAAALKAEGIPTAVYYPIPLTRQTGYRHFPCVTGGVPVSEKMAAQVISLPMHPYLEPAVQDRIIAAVRRAAA